MSLEGQDRLRQRWQRIPEVVKEMVRDAMAKTADAVVADMKRLAPKGATLELVNSIGWTWGDAPAGALTIGSVGGTEYGAMRITFYAGGGDAFYARFQEFGTVDMAANPFFFPVWRVWKKRARSRIAAAFRKAIKSA